MTNLHVVQPGFDSRQGMGIFPRNRIQTVSGAHPAPYTMDTGGLSPMIKRPGHKADHSLPSNAEDKKAWSYTSTPPIRFIHNYHTVENLDMEFVYRKVNYA
jgi:hypothetical protein